MLKINIHGAAMALIVAASAVGLSAHAQTIPQRPATEVSSSDNRPQPDTMTAVARELAALEAQVTTLQGQVASLQTNNAALESEVSRLKASSAAMQDKLAGASDVLALEPFLTVDATTNPMMGVVGPNITFQGANLHIVSGSGSTIDNGNPRGLGNLIIGYDEEPSQISTSLLPGDRGGSHNLVIGRYHRFTEATFGGLVVGELNAIEGKGASVTGGSGNTASGEYASVSGGFQNTAFGGGASISGGVFNAASDGASISGGFQNTASGTFATVTGGWYNTARGDFAGVSGGSGNIAAGTYTTVIGSTHVTAEGNASIAPAPPFP